MSCFDSTPAFRVTLLQKGAGFTDVVMAGIKCKHDADNQVAKAAQHPWERFLECRDGIEDAAALQ